MSVARRLKPSAPPSSANSSSWSATWLGLPTTRGEPLVNPYSRAASAIVKPPSWRLDAARMDSRPARTPVAETSVSGSPGAWCEKS